MLKETCNLYGNTEVITKRGYRTSLCQPKGNVKAFEFIKRMDLAFAAADVVITRAGAGTISELCLAGKASIFVPSPNVAEDHQTHNALALVRKNAAYMIPDDVAVEQVFPCSNIIGYR